MTKKSGIAEVVGKTLAPADEPIAVPGERTLEEIASDIVRKDQQVGLGLISIGNDLIEAKEKVDHGKWGEWLDLNVGYSERKAQMCMQIARRYGSNPQLVADLGIRKVTALMLLPAGEDMEFIETHDVANMSTRELEDAIRERDEARKRAEEAEAAAETARESREKMEQDMKLLKEQNALDRETTDKLRDRVKELENAPKEVYQDEAAIKAAADEARKAAEAEWSAKLKAAEDKLAKAKEAAKKAEEKAAQGAATSPELGAAKKAEAEAKAEAEQLRAELEEAKRSAAKATVAGDADLAAFQLLFESAQGEINKMHGILLKVRGRDEALAGKLTAALAALAEKVKECAK